MMAVKPVKRQLDCSLSCTSNMQGKLDSPVASKRTSTPAGSGGVRFNHKGAQAAAKCHM